MTEGGEVLDGMVLPGGESTAMGLIGTHRTNGKTVWEAIREFIDVDKKPTWGTCAGMILLAERCVGASAVIEDGQALIGGMDILVCRNYFGSQVSSFEMATPPPPSVIGNTTTNENSDESSYPGVFIRAPAILSAGSDVTVLGKVVATPCRQAAVVLQELERKIENGETVIQMGVVDALVRKSSQDSKTNITYRAVIKPPQHKEGEEEKKETTETNNDGEMTIELPGAADGSNAREVICAVQRNNLLCTAFHPELTNDHRWHKYFANMVRESMP
ncbi:MAG: 5'-phosphate synthase pdxT subunit [Bacillariaceae sp.]|jgi:5'-phosphate synthase pdxT subunit